MGVGFAFRKCRMCLAMNDMSEKVIVIHEHAVYISVYPFFVVVLYIACNCFRDVHMAQYLEYL